MAIPTEPIGSIPRPPALLDAIAASDPALDALYEDAIRDTVERFEATGSTVPSCRVIAYQVVPQITAQTATPRMARTPADGRRRSKRVKTNSLTAI